MAGKKWTALLVAGAAVGVGLGMDLQRSEAQIASGRADPEARPSGYTERWWQGKVRVTIDESMSKVWPDVEAGVTRAFDNWDDSGAKLPSVSFGRHTAEPLMLEPDGENRIYYVPITIAGHQHDLGMTLQHVSPSTGEILEADIVINSNHPFALLDAHEENGDVAHCSEQYDVASVVMHEIGHFWGLGEDMTDANTAMYFSTAPCNIAKRMLKADDVVAISSLYADELPDDETNFAAAAGFGHCGVASPPNRNAIDGFAIAGLASLLGVSVRRRARRTSRFD
jgi:hypothetical protein